MTLLALILSTSLYILFAGLFPKLRAVATRFWALMDRDRIEEGRGL